MIASGEMENILERYDESVRELVLRVNQEFDEYLMKPKTFPDFEQEFELFRLNHSCSEDFLTYLNERINIARWTKIAMEKRLIRKSFEELQIQHDPEKSETSGSLLMFNELLEFIGPSNSGNISPHSKVLNDTIDFNSTDTKDSLLSGSILANDHNITAATGRMCWFCEVYESNKTLVFTSLFHGKTNAAAKIYAISGVMIFESGNQLVICGPCLNDLNNSFAVHQRCLDARKKHSALLVSLELVEKTKKIRTSIKGSDGETSLFACPSCQGLFQL